MQGHRTSVGSLPDSFEFDHGSNSSNPVLDQQVYWNTMLNQVEAQTGPNYLLPPGDLNMSYVDVANQDNASLNIWHTGGPSSNDLSLNQGRHGETKTEHEWTSLTINPGTGRRPEERHTDAANMLSLEHVNINLNSDQVDDDQLFPQGSDPNDVRLNPEPIASDIGIRNEVSEPVLYPHSASAILKSEHAPSSSGSLNPYLSSPESFMTEDGDDRSGSSLDGRRIACKRKIIEGFPGQSSGSGSSSFFQQNNNGLLHSVPSNHNASTSINLSGSFDHMFDANTSEEPINPSIIRGSSSESYPSASLTGAGSSHRNFRMRMNPTRQNDILSSLYGQGNAARRSGVWLTNQPSSLIPFNQSLEYRPVIANPNSQGHLHMPVIPCLPRNMHSFPWNGASNSRIGNSSNPTNPEQSLLAMRDETNPRSIQPNNFSDQSLFVPANDVRHLVQDPSNWILANGGNSPSTSRAGAGSGSGVHPVVGPTWLSHQNPPQYSRSSSEVVRRSLFSSGGSDSGSQRSNFPLQRSGHSSTSHEARHRSATALRGHQQPHIRSAFSVERQNDGVLGVPLSMQSIAATREGRSRMMSEIRNALDLMRRGDNLRFEDVFILDHSLFIGGADLYDRHRDLRLDVDDMSYEELLALEERIGNVSTGLDEETILKCLKQWKHSTVRMESSTDIEEQCCVCREEYVEGEELGMLDCSHDFHAACIKQWLVHKNLCPICKTTALVT